MWSGVRHWWKWDGKMSSSRCDGESGEGNGREDREELIAAIPSSISEGEKKYLTIFLNPSPHLLFCPPLPPVTHLSPPYLPLVHHPSSLLLSPFSPLPSLPPPPHPPSLQEAVVNQVRLPQSLWSSLCPRSLAEAGVARRRRAADGGSAVNHCH